MALNLKPTSVAFSKLSPEVSNELQFLLIVGQLKSLRRTGWVKSNVAHPESVSDHMYRMAMAAFLIPQDSGLDRNKCIRMALVHDLAESVVGDITPHCGVSKADKIRMEREALSSIVGLLDKPGCSEEILALWDEFEQAVTPEAVFVQDVDKFEMILTALEYETEQKVQLPSFFESTKGFFKTDLVRSLDAEVRQIRNALQKPVAASLNGDSGVAC